MENSVQVEVMTRLATVISFIKSKTVSDLIEAKNKGMIELDDEELKRLSEIIKTSIQNSFVRSADEIIDYTNLLSENKKKNKKK